MADMVLGVFPDHAKADQTVAELKEAGYSTKDISVIMRCPSEGEAVAGSEGVRVVRGVVSDTAAGGVTGGIIGALAGLLIGIGAIAIPGLGPVLFVGPIATALGLTGAAAATASGAVIGAAAGGLVGALAGLGVSREEAKMYEKRIREGAVLLAVPTKEEKEDEAEHILSKHGAEQIRVVPVKT
jgi:uncharacterized membrane protein